MKMVGIDRKTRKWSEPIGGWRIPRRRCCYTWEHQSVSATVALDGVSRRWQPDRPASSCSHESGVAGCRSICWSGIPNADCRSICWSPNISRSCRPPFWSSELWATVSSVTCVVFVGVLTATNPIYADLSVRNSYKGGALLHGQPVAYAIDPIEPVTYANDTNRRCRWRR
jgi:hypothetical protein